MSRPKLPAGDEIDPFKAELSEAIRAVRTGRPSAVLAGELARDALVLCQKQTLSAIKRKRIAV